MFLEQMEQENSGTPG